MNWKRIVQLCLPAAVTEARTNVGQAQRVGLATPFRYGVGAAGRALEVSKLGALPPGALKAGIGTAVDVGAHVGHWSAAVLRVAKPRRMILVEPTPEKVARLSGRFADDRRVQIHEVAVGDHEGQASLLMFSSSDFNSLLPLKDQIRGHYAPASDRGTVTVRLSTLDNLLSDVGEIDVLKIDVQGFEGPILAGASGTLAKTKHVLIETNFASHYAGDLLIWDLHPLLEAAGFRLHRFGFEYHDRDGRLLWADAIYTRSP